MRANYGPIFFNGAVFGENAGNDNGSQASRGSRSKRSFGFRLRTYLTEGEDAAENGGDSNPIADLFPECTVLFADIVGFTAWSSMREPAQVCEGLMGH